MSDEIKPALTSKEWAEWIGGKTLWVLIDPVLGSVVQTTPTMKHRSAALALYGQKFGFTHDDVGLLRTVADSLSSRYEQLGDRHPEGGALYHDAQDLYALADRIAALLPPE